MIYYYEFQSSISNEWSFLFTLTIFDCLISLYLWGEISSMNYYYSKTNAFVCLITKFEFILYLVVLNIDLVFLLVYSISLDWIGFVNC